MPSRNVDGVQTRSMTPSKTPSKTPPGDGPPPVTPASGTGRKRKKKTSSRKKSGRKVAKKLDKSFDEDDVGSDGQESDASGTGSAGGKTPGGGRERVPDKPPPSALDALEASDDPLMKLVAQQLRASQAREAALQNELASVKADADARQAVRDYEDGAPTKFHFPPRVTKLAIAKFVEPFLRDDSTRRFYSQLEVTPSTQDSVTRAFATVNLTKSIRNKIFQRRLRDSSLSTKPRPLSDGEKTMYSKEQLAKEKALSQMHEDFSPVLQVLYHVLHHIAGAPDFADCMDSEYINHMEELNYQSEDLVQILLEYFGKHIAGPRRELFEKVTGLPVNPGKLSHGFMTEQEAESAMLVAQQQDVIQQHIAAVAPASRSRSSRARGGGKGGGKGGGLRTFRQQTQRGGRQQPQSSQQQPQQQQQTSQQQQPQQQPPAPSAGTPARNGQPRSTTPGAGKGKNRGGGKGK